MNDIQIDANFEIRMTVNPNKLQDVYKEANKKHIKIIIK